MARMTDDQIQEISKDYYRHQEVLNLMRRAGLNDDMIALLVEMQKVEILKSISLKLEHICEVANKSFDAN